MKKILQFTFLLLFINCCVCLAQTNKIQYVPKQKDSLIKYITSISEKKISKLGGKNKKVIKKLINERKTDFIKKLDDSSFVFDDKILKCLKKIQNEIYKSNTIIDYKDFYFFVDKSPLANAACYGNGIFTVNLGLFNIVENEDELAFIICHEMAHFILEHNDKSILEHIKTINSDETKSRIKEVKNTEYSKMKLYRSLMKDLSFNFLKRNRKVEIQADSLGLVLFKNTQYNKNSSISSLKKLENIDEIAFNEDTNLKTHFDFVGYPFKEVWLSKDETLFDAKESVNDYALNKDSLKSHPDIAFRIDLLKKYISNEKNSKSINTSEIIGIKKLVAESSITVALDDLALDFALYQTLILFNKKDINEKQYFGLVSFILIKTYESKKNHNFGKYVDNVNSFSEEKYLNEIRSFLHNIELKNLRKIGFEFCLKFKNTMSDDLEFKKTIAYFKALNQ